MSLLQSLGYVRNSIRVEGVMPQVRMGIERDGSEEDNAWLVQSIGGLDRNIQRGIVQSALRALHPVDDARAVGIRCAATAYANPCTIGDSSDDIHASLRDCRARAGTFTLADRNIRNPHSIRTRLHIMRANNMRAFQYRRRLGSQRSIKTFADVHILPVLRQCAPYERFSRNSDQERAAQLVEFFKPFQQGIILLKTFPEAETRIQNDALPLHA